MSLLIQIVELIKASISKNMQHLLLSLANTWDYEVEQVLQHLLQYGFVLECGIEDNTLIIRWKDSTWVMQRVNSISKFRIDCPDTYTPVFGPAGTGLAI